VQDAVAVYDEMLAYRDFIGTGTVLSYRVPPVQGDSAIWSGMRAGNRAVIRTFKQGEGSEAVTVDPWPGHPVTLNATSAGKTYVLSYDGARVTISR
jgi:hypothetical protein